MADDYSGGGGGRSGKNAPRNLDAVMRSNSANSRAKKLKQGSKKADPNFLPF